MLNAQRERRRIKQLAYMICQITGIDFELAEQLVVETDIGKRILQNDVTLMYEQQTENLAEIALEFKEKKIHLDIVSQLTIEKIAAAAWKVGAYDQDDTDKKITAYAVKAGNVADKEHIREKLMHRRRQILKIKQQNQMNAGRIENANKLKK